MLYPALCLDILRCPQRALHSHRMKHPLFSRIVLHSSFLFSFCDFCVSWGRNIRLKTALNNTQFLKEELINSFLTQYQSGSENFFLKKQKSYPVQLPELQEREPQSLSKHKIQQKHLGTFPLFNHKIIQKKPKNQRHTTTAHR
jgi:hypothetical protein